MHRAPGSKKIELAKRFISEPGEPRCKTECSADLDPLNHMQIELLKRYRGGDTGDDVVTGIHLTINGLAAGLRNSG